MKTIIHSDGGSRGNPGEAAVGAVVDFGDKQFTVSEKIGVTTNNVAEYEAILRGLRLALKEGASEAHCFLDSELVVRQLNGVYRIKDIKMKELAEKIFLLVKQFNHVTFVSIPREKNKKADALVNKALDGK